MKLPEVLDLLPEGYLLISQAGRILARSRAARAWLPEDAIGSDLADLNVAGADGCARLLDRLRNTTHMAMGTFALVTKSGRVVRYRVEGLPWRGAGVKADEDKPPLLTRWTPQSEIQSGVQSDESYKKLEAMNLHMSRVVARLRLENEDLESFVSIVAHDLKSPLRGMGMYAQLLQARAADQLDEDCASYVDHIVKLSRRGYDLIGDLSRFARIGREAPKAERVDLGEVVGGIRQELVGSLLREQDRIEVMGTLPVIRHNEGFCHTILANLIGNGLKYNESPVRIVEIGLTDESDELELYVRDNGIGIAPERQEDIFQMFRRLHGQAEFGGGTGAGLAFVQRMIESTGGAIRLESLPGEGSTFYVRFGRIEN